jgi:hypothetical protein
LSSAAALEVSSRGQDKGETVWRALAALMFVVLAFGCAALLALLFAITRRRPRLTAALAASAIALGTLSIVIGSV